MEKFYKCTICGLKETNRKDWCDMGCGSDYNDMVELVYFTDVMKIVKKEKETWAEQSIGWKAVESVELALNGK